ncbi:hypothetical protein KQ224_00980 [Streptococcus parasuis]|uniref:hypothetical protein n=1 Tax=Streptococcus parasuis TaxID=1501662 RepID=UPI001C1F9BCC|nr:hypothetical protein [Streptococcus parasuis]QWV86745.1 hypothetical protein KQ224_00980 [Streptococcus parasuis]WFB91139.1 hypothetical protein NWE22_05675 [Streptococcus parasuis]
MEKKLLEKINKKVIAYVAIGLVSIGIVIYCGVLYNEYKQEQIRIETIKKETAAEKVKVDSLFKDFNIESEESIQSLKRLSEMKFKTKGGVKYLKSKVKSTSEKMIKTAFEKVALLNIKEDDAKFKDKNALQENINKIKKYVDFATKINKEFPYSEFEKELKSSNAISSKLQSQLNKIKQEEKAAEEAKKAEEARKAEEAKKAAEQAAAAEVKAQAQAQQSSQQETYDGYSGQSYSNNDSGGGYSSAEEQSYYSGDSSYQAPATDGGSSGGSSSNAPSGGGIVNWSGYDAYGNTSSGSVDTSTGTVYDQSGNVIGDMYGGIADIQSGSGW